MIWAELRELAGTRLVEFSPEQRRFRQLVAHALSRPVDERGDWSFLDRLPGWLADQLAQHSRWASVRWPEASVRDRLALAALAVLGDELAWFDGGPGPDEMQRQVVTASEGLGRTSCANGDLTDALGHHRDALAIAEELELPRERATAHDGLGHVHLALGELDEVRHHWGRAVEIGGELGLPETRTVRDQLAALGAPTAANG